ncbi:succinate--CoA ligase subunit alpha [Pseudodesulfovibrio sp. F-1]|uniref:Succinate--CoA ligase [ADP-forming] subunit alpha n=1 Tax=Pseudodesulfovibrio alkaliphilus TaxID=2661613 RepID=A0A7K1KQV5_9BACT|nr:succinate--CoA ligase subunit alpha [Pseudodesulfovibrio alkaliphilus]MUM78457.1 succinate--CoA ligase subunit alpha [Pseudodesulfovibrio alkaliphilus]
MLLNEHMSKALFAKAGIPVPHGQPVFPGSEDDFNPPFALPWILKAQVPIGGRGKVGGILRVKSSDAFAPTARKLFGLDIRGHRVPFVRVEPVAAIQREMYLSLTVSRSRGCILLTVGREGGVDIESGGQGNLLVQEIRLPAGISAHQMRAAFFHLGLDKERFADFSTLIKDLFKAMLDNGLLLAEINPLIITDDQRFVALDAKVEVDDNFVELNPAMEAYYQPEHASPEENAARKAGFSYVSLDGWVGLMVNGAGLAMATMDLLNFSRLPARNFLDLGGTADHARMRTALDLLFGDTRVRAVFINLYGGILSCRNVALALREALGGHEPEKPIVTRMAGNDAAGGVEVLTAMGCSGLHLARDMADAIRILDSIRPADAPVIEFPAPGSALPEAMPVPRNHMPTKTLGISADTPILVQGITGREGQLHTQLMQAYGANVVAGVTPFKGGQTVLGVPVFNSIAEATRDHEIGASIIFVPPRMAADAVLEAACNKIPWAVCITEGIPQQDMLAVFEQINSSPTRVVGPNTPGVILPGRTKIGIMPTDPFSPGPVAILSRSGTLTYEVASRLTAAGIGQSVCIGIGGDPFIGVDYVDAIEMLCNHDETQAVIILGEIGGRAEENLAEHIVRTGFAKPVTAFIAGRTAPPGKRLGHAGAILEKGDGVDRKLETMRKAGFAVCASLEEVAQIATRRLG